MQFEMLGFKDKPVILFFHTMGVTGDSSKPVAQYLKDDYCIVLPTSTVYCKEQKYISKLDEVKQVKDYLDPKGFAEILISIINTGKLSDLDFLRK